MAKTLQHRRGTTAELASVTGAVGEIFMDTTKNTLVVFDDQSPSAPHTLATEAFVLANSGGGSGSSYNQSLNTTDDIVFNSGLIGNVSIIADQIAGVDSYGNNDTLTLSGTTVNISPAVDRVTTVTTTHPKVYDPNALGGMGGYTYGNVSTGNAGSGYYVQIAGVTNQAFFDAILALPVGAQIVVHGDMSGVITVTLSANFTAGAGYGLGSLTASIVESNFNIDESVSQIDSVVTTHSAQSASYVFAPNATIGVNQDFSILADTSSLVTTPVTINPMASLSWRYDSMSGKSWFGFIGGGGGGHDQYFKAGMTVNCFDLYSGAPITLTLKTDMAYNMYVGAGSYVAETVEVHPNTGMDTYISRNNVSTTVSSGTTGTYTFGTDGTFTSDSVVATSALLGDVSIIGNTIAALDSYGNPSELAVSASSVAFDSDVNLSVNSLVSTTETVSAGMNSFSFNPGMPGTPTFTYSGGMVDSSWADASKFVTGTIVTITSTMYGNAVIQLTSDMAYVSPGWRAPCTIISGGSSSISMLSSVSVTNEVGSTADYSFDDQGVFTAPTVSTNSLSTNSLLINGSAPALLTANIDGSKSIVVDKLVTTSYAGQMMNNDPTKVHWNAVYWDGTMYGGQPGKLRFSDPNTFTINLFSGLVAGDQITLKRDLGAGMPGGDVTLTVQTAGFTYDMAQMRYILDVVETNTDMSDWTFLNTYGVTVTSLGSQEHNFSGSALTTNSVIATDALIGDVSIVGNTIAGVDSYGLADKLIVDGDLEVTGDLTSPSALTVSVGGGISSTTLSGYTGMPGSVSWSDTTFQFPSDIDSSISSLLLALPVGSHIKFVNYMYGTFDLVTTSTVSVTGTGQYAVSVPSTYNYGWGVVGGTNVNGITIEQTIPTANYEFGTDGKITANGTTVGSVSAVGAVGSYAMLTIGGNNGNINPGSTVTSSGMTGPLFFAGQHIDSTGAGDTYTYPMGADGTWMCMGYAPTATYDMSVTTLWYRVS